jgi:hypothetical protein
VLSLTAHWTRGSRVTRGRGARALVAALACAALVAGACGCARVGPPGGGPPDKEPPYVVTTVPGNGVVSVDRLTPLSIEFSEEMDRRSVERSFSTNPAAELGNFRWKGSKVTARPRSELPDSTTIVVRIGSAARDHHEISIEQAYTFAFATGPTLDSGIITGTVTTEGEPVRNATVWACHRVAEPDSLGTMARCGYVGATDDDGSFRLEHVRAWAKPYTVVAFVDSDGDGKYGVGSENGLVLDGAAFVRAPGDSIGGITVPIVAPSAGGRSGEGGPEE